ncbi:MAG: hypothetical protein AB7P03_16055 [Kofleriaceae bacterium]
MADPWSNDLAALGEQTKADLSSPAMTRASALNSLHSHAKESKMRLFKHHPVLAAVVVIACLGLFAPLTYAFVNHVFLSVDPDKSASEIETDVKTQLQNAGIVPDQVTAEKTPDGQVSITIHGDERLDPDKLKVTVPGGGAELSDAALMLKLDVRCTLTDAQQARLQTAAIAAMSNPELGDVAGITDQQFRDIVTSGLADHGFHDVEVKLADDGKITIVVNAPPV